MKARVRRRPRDVSVELPLGLRAVPGRSRRPADGRSLLVEASVVARLFGRRLLTLDAAVVVTPADVTTPLPGSRDGRTRASVRSPIAPTPAGAAGRGLAEAVRKIDESAAILAHARRDAGVRRR